MLALRHVDEGLAACILGEQGVTYKDLERTVRDVLGKGAGS